MSSGAAAAPSACWNCRQPISPGTARCIWCGVPLTESAAPLVVAPAAAPAPAAPLMAPAPAAPVIAPPAATPPVAALPARSRRRPLTVDFSGVFRGVAAGAGLRVVALTIDLLLVAAVAGGMLVAFRSPLLAAATVAEALLLLWILDARTGATPGKALLRLRTAREDAPMSPGAGRSLGRGVLHGAGFLVGVGPWIVAASSAFDPGRRGWADRATRTVTLAVPSRPVIPGAVPVGATPVGTAAAPAMAPPAVAPGVAPAALPPLPPTAAAPPAVTPAAVPAVVAPASAAPPAVGLAEPRVVSTAAPRSPIDEESASQSGTGIPVLGQGAVPQVAPPAATPAAGEEAGVSLLLVFDTGQRERFAAPVAINLGRNPAPTAEGDRLVAVQDPESTVSKTHARLEHSRGATWITDGGSTNGTEILSDEGDVTPLAPGVRTLLDEGDRVRLGRRVFTVSVILGDGAA